MGRDVVQMLFHLLDRVFVDQRPGGNAVAEPVADIQLGHRFGQLGGERVINAGLHVDPVGADAGLAVVAEFAQHRAFDRGVEIGIVEDDERRVAAQFHRTFHHLVGGLAQQDAADLGRAGEGELAHLGVLAEFLAGGRGGAGRHHVEHAGRNAGAFGQHRQHDGRQRGFLRGPRDKGAAGRQRRRRLAGDHRIGEVPRRDRGRHADGLLDHGDALVALVAGDGFAIDALGLFGEELDEGGAVMDLAHCLGFGFALFGGQDDAQVLGIFGHQVEPLAQQVRPFLAGQRRPLFLRGIGGVDRFGHLRARQVGDLGDHIAPRRVGDIEGAVAAIDPGAVHIGAAFQQRGVVQQGFEIGRGVQHDGLPRY